MIKNIVFDFGGVLINFNPKEFLSNLFNDTDIEEKVLKAVFGSKYWVDLDAGIVTREQAESKMLEDAKALGVLSQAKESLEKWWDMLTAKEDTIELVKILHSKGYPLYYLSNLPEDLFEKMKIDFDFWQYFNGGVISSLVKMTKPSAEIFDLLCKNYDLIPSETVFADDTLKNVNGAIEYGMKSVLFTTSEEFEKYLISKNIL